MNKKIIGFFIVGLFLVVGILPIATSSNFDDQLDQEQTEF